MLHIISITEIRFRKLTRKWLGMTSPDEESPTVEETIDLAREMQAIRPETPEPEPEVDYGDDDGDKDTLATPSGTRGRKGGRELFNKLGARANRQQRDQTLGRAFLRNFEKLAHQIRHESAASDAGSVRGADTHHRHHHHHHQQDAANHLKQNFGYLERKSLSTIVKLANDQHYKQHILKRAKEARRNWKRAFGKLRGGRFQFTNLVEEMKERREEEEEAERLAREVSAAEGLPPAGGYGAADVQVHSRPDDLPPPPASLLRSSVYRRSDTQRASARRDERFDITSAPQQDYPGYAGDA
jgi:hypothetical protein